MKKVPTRKKKSSDEAPAAPNPRVGFEEKVRMIQLTISIHPELEAAASALPMKPELEDLEAFRHLYVRQLVISFEKGFSPYEGFNVQVPALCEFRMAVRAFQPTAKVYSLDAARMRRELAEARALVMR